MQPKGSRITKQTAVEHSKASKGICFALELPETAALRMKGAPAPEWWQSSVPLGSHALPSRVHGKSVLRGL